MQGLPLTETIPPPHVVRATIGGLLRELEIARGLLRLSKLAEQQRSLTAIAIPNQTPTPSATDAASR